MMAYFRSFTSKIVYHQASLLPCQVQYGRQQKWYLIRNQAYTHETLESRSVAYTFVFWNCRPSFEWRVCHVSQSGHKQPGTDEHSACLASCGCLALCTAQISVSRTGSSKFGRAVTSPTVFFWAETLESFRKIYAFRSSRNRSPVLASCVFITTFCKAGPTDLCILPDNPVNAMISLINGMILFLFPFFVITVLIVVVYLLFACH